MAISDLDHESQLPELSCSKEQAEQEARDSLQALIEGLLFIAGEEGLSVIQMQSVMQETTRQDIEKILREMQKEYAEKKHGFELACYGSRWKFVSKDSVYDQAKKLYEEIIVPVLSSAALETLAIIAYRQPITRAEIEEIRGVSCEAMLKKLQARSLIEAKDRLDAVGKPLLYTVTETFFDTFGIRSLDELPEMVTEKEHAGLFTEEQSENAEGKTEKAGTKAQLTD